MATVLITGANRGIGLALTKVYTAAGDDVIATAREPQNAIALQKAGAEILALDVTDPASISNLSERLGTRPVDLLINNAGVGDRQSFGALDYARWRAVMDVNTLAPLHILETLVDNVASSDGRMVANISSQLGSIENTEGDMGLIYRVSKAALNMALRAAATPLAERGITLLALHPGWVKTDMGGDSAPITPEESAYGLHRVIADAGHADTLRFLDWRGAPLPW